MDYSFSCEFPLTDSISFLFVSPRWTPVVCWRRGWTLRRCLTDLQKHFPTHLSTPKPSCSRVQLYRLTMFWLGPASSTNTRASSSPCRLAPSTWSTGSSISPRTRWRCPGEQMTWLLRIILAPSRNLFGLNLHKFCTWVYLSYRKCEHV